MKDRIIDLTTEEFCEVLQDKVLSVVRGSLEAFKSMYGGVISTDQILKRHNIQSQTLMRYRRLEVDPHPSFVGKVGSYDMEASEEWFKRNKKGFYKQK